MGCSTLVEDNLHLAEMVARSIPRPNHIDLDDYVQDARIGLMEAAEKFDPELGWKFSTYAARLMHGRIQDGLRDRDHLSRGHRKAVKDGEKTDCVNVSLEQLVERVAEAGGAAGERGTTPSFLRFEEGGFRGVEDRMWWDWLRGLTWRLSDRQRQAVVLYFFEGHSHAEVGERLGITESGACFLANRGAIKLGQLIREAERLDYDK